jgi:ribosomal protein S6--L-glutamate ligase
MKILILSRNPRLYSTRRQIQSFRARGHVVTTVDPLDCELLMDKGHHTVLHQGKPLEGFALVVPRISTNITEYGLAVLHHFEIQGIPVLNGALAVMRARDKLRCLQILSKRGVDVPKTMLIRNPRSLEASVARVEGPPVILKLLQGTQGVGVMLAESVKSAESVLDTLWGLGQNIIVQKFVAESRGKDIRAFVVGNEVVAAMRRRAQEGEFRSNIHRGGTGERVRRLPESYHRTAVRAAKILGLKVAGVDILEGAQGPLVMEVNASPGLEGIEATTGVDIAGRIADFAMRFVKKARRKKARLAAR